MPFGIIYKVTNLINNKCYIGQTKQKDFVKYWIGHLKVAYKSKSSTRIFYRAIQKYGPENFLFETIEFCDSKEELDEMEFHYIKQYKNYINEDLCNGYNMSMGGDGGNIGNQFTNKTAEERKSLVRFYDWDEEKKEKFLDEKYRGKNHYTKRIMTLEDFTKWKENRKGKNNGRFGDYYTWEERYGKEKAAILKQKRREIAKNQKMSDNTKKAISFANSGIRNANAKQYKLIFPNKEEIITKSLPIKCKKLGIIYKELLKTLTGELENCNGYKIILLNGELNDLRS